MEEHADPRSLKPDPCRWLKIVMDYDDTTDKGYCDVQPF